MKKYILLSVIILTSGMNLIGMKRKHPEDALLKTDVQTKECQICWDDKESDQFKTLSCCESNASCTDCLLDLIKTRLAENSATIVCPNRACEKEIAESNIRAITQSHRDIYQKFYNIALKEYLAKQKNIKHCPTPDCPYSFINDTMLKESFECPQCNYTYCSNCLVLHGQEITCEQAVVQPKSINKKIEEEMASEEWKKSHSKKCPNCAIDIEKNQGCNHMTCKKCKHEFCWTCGAKYRTTTCNSNFCETIPENAQQRTAQAPNMLQIRLMLRVNHAEQQLDTRLQAIPEDLQQIIRQGLDAQRINRRTLALQLNRDISTHEKITELKNRFIQLQEPTAQNISDQKDINSTIKPKLLDRLQSQDTGWDPELQLITTRLEKIEQKIRVQEKNEYSSMQEKQVQQRKQLEHNYQRQTPQDQEFNQLCMSYGPQINQLHQQGTPQFLPPIQQQPQQSVPNRQNNNNHTNIQNNNNYLNIPNNNNHTGPAQIHTQGEWAPLFPQMQQLPNHPNNNNHTGPAQIHAQGENGEDRFTTIDEWFS